MASPGLLFLLMVSSSLLLSVLSTLSYSKQPAQGPAGSKNTKEKEKSTDAVIYVHKVLTEFSPFLQLLPKVGGYVPALIKVTELIMSEAGVIVEDDTVKLIKAEFKKLNLKIDFVQSKWDTIERDFNNAGNNIKDAWKDYEDLLKVFSDPKNLPDERQNHVKRFKELSGKIVLQVRALHNLLKKTDPTSTRGGLNKFGKTMAEHVRCHDKEIGLFSLITNVLLYQGNVMSHYFDKLQKVDKLDDLVKNTFNSARILFQIREYCMSKFMNYIKEDIDDLMEEPETAKKSRQEQAHEIRMFLEEKHDKYNWMVVVFFTAHSDRTIRFNLHTIEGFTRFPVGPVTVAIAKQVKGTHTMAKKVSQKIDECIKKAHKLNGKLKIKCKNVPNILNKCKLTVDGHKVYDTITAIHAFLNKNEGSTSAKEIPKEIPEEFPDYDNKAPYFYEGECVRMVKHKGTFVVLIKSDEELGGEKAICKNMKCGTGKCELVKDTAIPVCKCDERHYGQSCNTSFDEYKQLIEKEKMPKIQSTKRRVSAT